MMNSTLTKFIKVIPVVFGIEWLGNTNADVVFWLFAQPAAWLASKFFGCTPIQIGSQEILLAFSNQEIHVVASCSGFSFFCITVGLILSYVFHLKDKSQMILATLAALPLAYVLTVVVNALRIICAYYVHDVVRVFLPSSFQAAAHQGVGIMLFLSALLGVVFVLERKFSYGK